MQTTRDDDDETTTSSNIFVDFRATEGLFDKTNIFVALDFLARRAII